MDYNEFSEKIKTKYPEYKDIDNMELAQKMIAKYPEYQEQVSFNIEKPQEQAQQKNIDLTPSGIINNTSQAVADAILTPVEMIKSGETNPIKAYNTVAKRNKEVNKEIKKQTPVLSGVKDLGLDLLGYSMLPVAKGGGIVNFAKNAVVQGGVPMALESLKRGGNALGGLAGGSLLGAGIQSLPYVGKVASTGVAKIANNPTVQKNIAKTLEVLTSVPEKYTKRALKKELQGQSILSKKYDPDSAYRTIENQLRNAKSKLTTKEQFADKFYNLGQQAKESLQNVKEAAGREISEMLEGMNPEPIDIEPLRKSIDTVINNFGKGGSKNPAKIRAGKDIDLIRDLLGGEGELVKPIDLHNAKETLYDIANYNTEGGIRNDVLKRTANQINNFLRSKFPEYKIPNDRFASIKKIEYDLGGINSNTIGGKLAEYGSEGNVVSGLDRRLRNINDILPTNEQFIKPTEELVKEQSIIDNINKTINSSYERNPRLLSNINDTAREQALADLQSKSGINFMDELNDIRAQEALEKWFPGQGGGSGTSEGFGNLLRTAIIGGAPTAAAVAHNPLALAGLGLVSPKFMAQGTIKNLGKLSNLGEKIKNLSPLAQRLLTPLAVKGAAPILYGGIEYNDIQ